MKRFQRKRMQETKKAKIIPFRQDSAFYIKRGDRKADQNNLPAALSRYRLAYDRDPSDPEACMALAEMLNRMQLFDESNRVLLSYISMYETMPDFFFGAASNFYGLSEFEYAHECLVSYLQADPHGPYAEMASEFLSILEDEEELAYELGIGEEEDFATLTIVSRAQNLLAAGETEPAMELLQGHIRENPDAWRAKLSLANACFVQGSTRKAERLTDEVLKSYPDNILAGSTKAHILFSTGRKQQAREILSGLDFKNCEQPEAFVSAATVEIELKMNREAYALLKEALEYLPFDRQILHLFGYVSRMLGEYEDAEKAYSTLSRMDASDTIAPYYLNAVRSEKNGNRSRVQWSIDYALPVSVAMRRIMKINELFLDDLEKAKEKWETDRGFRNQIKWILTLPDTDLQYTMLLFLGEVGGLQAELVLRDFALRMEERDSLKQEAMTMLKNMGAKEPYMGYLNSQWVTGSVSVSDTARDMPDDYFNVFMLAMQHMEPQADRTLFMDTASGALNDYIQKFETPPRIRSSQAEVYAAALELLTYSLMGMEVSSRDICEKYGITNLRLMNAYKKLTGSEADGK